MDRILLLLSPSPLPLPQGPTSFIELPLSPIQNKMYLYNVHTKYIAVTTLRTKNTWYHTSVELVHILRKHWRLVWWKLQYKWIFETHTALCAEATDVLYTYLCTFYIGSLSLPAVLWIRIRNKRSGSESGSVYATRFDIEIWTFLVYLYFRWTISSLIIYIFS